MDHTTNNPTMDRVNKGLKRRYRAERRFRFFGATAIFAALLFLFLLLLCAFLPVLANFLSAFLVFFLF